MDLTLEEKAELLLLYKQKQLEDAKISFQAFVSYVMPHFRWNFHHEIIAERLSRLRNQTRQFITVAVPAQTGKSELVSRKLPAWMLGINPNCRIMVIGYSTTFAEMFNTANQKLMVSEDYLDVFPDTKIEGKKKGLLSNKKTSQFVEIIDNEGFLRTVGIGAGSSGFPCDLLIIDDPYPGMEEALRKKYREMVWRWFTSVGLQRLSKIASVVMLNTRWHKEDLIGMAHKNKKLLKEYGFGDIEDLRFPSLADNNLHPEDPRKFNESLWPEEKGTTEQLLAKKGLIGEYMFNSMEQGLPPSIGSGLIKTKNFGRYHKSELPAKFDILFTSWDLNMKPNAIKDSDPIAGLTIGYKKPKLYCLGLQHQVIDFAETIDLMITTRGLWRTDGDLIEEKANGAAAESTLKNVLKMKGIMTYNPTVDKITRVVQCQVEINAGDVLFPYEPWVDDFFTECDEFPEGDHDDRVDVLTQAILWLRENGGKLGLKKLYESYGVDYARKG